MKPSTKPVGSCTGKGKDRGKPKPNTEPTRKSKREAEEAEPKQVELYDKPTRFCPC